MQLRKTFDSGDSRVTRISNPANGAKMTFEPYN